MKKIILVLIVLFCVSGCGKKLVCTYEENYEDIKIRNKITFNFKDNIYNQVDKMIFSSEEDAKEYFDSIEDYIDEYNLKLDGKAIVSNLDDKINSNLSKKEIKTKYESYDYKCK